MDGWTLAAGRYDMAERRDQHWTLRKDISVGDLVALSLAIGAVAFAYFTLDRRIAILEDWRLEIKEQLTRMDHKLDVLIERSK